MYYRCHIINSKWLLCWLIEGQNPIILVLHLKFQSKYITFEYELKTKIDLRLILPVRKFKIQSYLIR